MTKNYKSVAVWPESSGIFDEYGKNESSDYHDSKEQAQSICEMLEREGLGGIGKIFPILTYVETL